MDRVLNPGTRWLRPAALVAVGLAGACFTEANPEYCDDQTACTDSVRSFCDLHGDFGEFSHRCIEPPVGYCEETSDCTTATLPICGDGKICEGCDFGGTGAADCAAIDSERELCRDDGACVSCIDGSDCGAATPICDHGAGSCRGCLSHNECASEVCQEDGTCEEPSKIIYVDSDGTDSATCASAADPCATIGGVDGGLAKLTPTRTVVKIRAATYREAVVMEGLGFLRLVGPAIISAPSLSNTAAIQVNGPDETFLTLEDITLANGSGGASAAGVGCGWAVVDLIGVTIIGNQGFGIESASCDITISRSTIASNDAGGISVTNGDLTMEQSTVSDNPGGGIEIVDATYTLRNDFIVDNGTSGSGGTAFGGVSIALESAMSPLVIDFNTIAGNQSQSAADAGGVICQVGTQFIGSGNIIWGNTGGAPSVSGNCGWNYSDIAGGLLGETYNLDEDPRFVDASNGDYHIESTSPCKNMADPGATLEVDFDGDSRPADGRADIGADELVE